MHYARSDLRDIQEVLPYLWLVERFCHEIRNLLFGIDVNHADSWMTADFEYPMNIDAMSSW